MRVGACPTRVKRRDFHPAKVTACVLAYIPHRHDYYAHRFDVLRLCLDSLAANTPRDRCDVLVMDNGSCPEVVGYLHGLREQGRIDYLILSSRNIGKISACRMMFDAAPGDIVAYADDDVLFLPGWLEAQLDILERFPRVGMVSARPVRKQFAYGNGYLAGYLAEFPAVSAQYGRFIPDEWEREYLRSTGRPETQAEEIAARHRDILLDCQGLRAYSTACHFHFIAPRAVILAALAKHDQPRTGSEERKIEEAVDAMGYARLSTTERHVRHLGNVISQQLRDELGSALPSPDHVATWRPAPPFWVRLSRLRLVRAVLARVNRWSFFLLHHP
jgi:glycosyltransferase involved in cell wall biosynthesis